VIFYLSPNLRFKSFKLTAGGIDRAIITPYEVTQMGKWSTSHAGFNPTTLANNIALIQMTNAFPISELIIDNKSQCEYTLHMVSDIFIDVIRLPKQSNANTTFANINSIATGYGSTNNGIL
jgi:hypothetical protein